MKKCKKFYFDDVIPIICVDEDRIEIRAKELTFNDYRRGVFGFAILAGIVTLFILPSGISTWLAIASMIVGFLGLKYTPKSPAPILIFVEGSREIRFRRGDSEQVLDLTPDPFSVWIAYGRGTKTRTIQIHCRDKKGAQIWCKRFPSEDKVAFIAAFLDAFIHGDEGAAQKYVPKIKIS